MARKLIGIIMFILGWAILIGELFYPASPIIESINSSLSTFWLNMVISILAIGGIILFSFPKKRTMISA